MHTCQQLLDLNSKVTSKTQFVRREKHTYIHAQRHVMVDVRYIKFSRNLYCYYNSPTNVATAIVEGC